MSKIRDMVTGPVGLVGRQRRSVSTPSSTASGPSGGSSSPSGKGPSVVTTTSSAGSSSSAGAAGTVPSGATVSPPHWVALPTVRGFFDDVIAVYVLPDIQRLTREIRPEGTGPKKGLWGCTVPLALFLFAVADLFGFLVRPDKDANKRNTERNFKYLLAESGYLPIVYKGEWEKIYQLYRNGLVHQILPKPSGIAKAGLGTALIHVVSGVEILNVDRLSEDVVRAIGEVRAKVEQGTDRGLVMRMGSRLKQLVQQDQDVRMNLYKYCGAV